MEVEVVATKLRENKGKKLSHGAASGPSLMAGKGEEKWRQRQWEKGEMQVGQKVEEERKRENGEKRER